MTISTESNKTIGRGNGVTTTWPYSFQLPSASDLVVSTVDSDGTITQLTPLQYTVSGVGSLTGGTVVYPLAGSPLASGTSIVLERVVPYVQEAELENQGGYFPAVVEAALDNLQMQIQQLAGGALNQELALVFPSVDVSPETILPPAAARAGMVMGFDGNGDPVMLNPSLTLLPGDISAYTVKATGGTTARTLADWLGDRVNVKSKGAIGNGITDDTAAIQAAVDAVTGTGGSVYFPPGRYKVTAQINVSSLYPVNLIADFGTFTDTSPYGVFIQIGGAIAGSVFKYYSPAARYQNGAGTIRGLSFLDPTGVASSAPGTSAITGACLELHDFTLGLVEDCWFHCINGSAIKTEFCVMTNVRSSWIRYCGAAAKPALYLASDGGGVYITQSCCFSDLKLEVNYSAAYISELFKGQANRFIGCSFEADTAIAGSNQVFFSSEGFLTHLSSCNFDRNTGAQIDIGANANLVTFDDCTFNTNGPTGTIVCNSVTFDGCSFVGAYTGVQLSFTNGGAILDGCRFRGGGSIELNASSTMIGGEVRNNTTVQPYAITATDGSNVQGVNIQGNATGGLKLSGTCPSAIGNTIHQNGAIGLRNESPNAAISGNRSYNNTGADGSFTQYPIAYDANANFFFDNSTPLRTVVVYDPPAIADGAIDRTNVTVNGAAGGDLVSVGFSQGQTGMVITGTVLAANTVEVVFFNKSGGIVDLPSGNLTVTVRKAA